MTNRHETARLSDYLDGELAPAERAEVESHLAGCRECAEALEELRSVVSTAAELPDLPPEHDLWPGIEARLSPRRSGSATDALDRQVLPFRRHRRVMMTIPQLAAAAIALVLFSASAVWLAVGGAPEPGSEPVVSAAAASPVTNVVFSDFEQTVSVLEEEYRDRRSDLDAETIRVVERNLAIIDQAIEEARDALASDPSSGFLSGHLANSLRQKMDLLRRAAAIAQTET